MAEKLIAENRRARHDYHLLERIEAGLVLTGTEVKSLREGRVTLAQSFADIRDGEAWLHGARDRRLRPGQPREPRARASAQASAAPARDRLALRHGAREGADVVPTRLYFKDGRVKVELAVARGKEQRDKRRDAVDRDAKRQIERALKAQR